MHANGKAVYAYEFGMKPTVRSLSTLREFSFFNHTSYMGLFTELSISLPPVKILGYLSF